MDLKLQLFVREHRTGAFTVQLVGDPEMVVYAETLEKALEDLELAISDRVERTHPRHQSTFSAPLAFEKERLELDALFPVFDGARTFAPGEVSVLVADNRAWRTMWFPRFGLHYFVPTKGTDWREAAKELLAEHLEVLSDHARLELRVGREERVEALAIETRPPKLSAFTGRYRALDVLPLAAEEEEREEAQQEAEEEKKAGTKKVPTPTLEAIGVPLSRLAEDGELERAVARDAEASELLRLLRQRKQACVAVVGPSGVGKTTLLNELVHRLRDESLPDSLRTRPVWFVDATRLIAGEGFFGDWQRQTFDVLEECEAARVIWYVGSLLPLLDAGKHVGSELNVSQLVKPFLAGRRVTVVGEASDREWAQLELRDAGFSRLFTPYRLAEPAASEARRILVGIAAEVKAESGVETTEAGLDAIEQLCRRYSEGSRLGSAASLLRRATEGALAAGKKTLGRLEVISHFCLETGLPELLLRDDVPLDPAEVERAFRKRLVGQTEAVRRMADLVAVIKAGLSDLSRPLGGFLFVGPTGVGKTETAKSLAEFLFGSEERLVRFDMSEYVGPDAIHRFLGQQGQEGKLVSAIRKQPFSVVLLDEIEKADPAIFDVLLQVLGEARLTDEEGRTASFENAVVILTSNLGVDTLSGSMGFSEQSPARAYHAHFMDAAEKFFRPEFFNRLDHVVSFRPLEAEAIERITERELDKFARREGIRGRGLSVRIGPGVQGWLSSRGVDPRYGARPLKRVLERNLAMPLARHLCQHRGARALEVRPDGEALAFEPVEASRADGQARAQAGLARLLRDVDEARFQLSRWMQSRPYRELMQQLRLLDQVSRNKHFWKDRARAEARTRAMQSKLDLRSAFEDLDRRLAGLEDVALEAYYDRDEEPAGMIADDLAQAREALAGLELGLFASRFERPDAVTLHFRVHEGGVALLSSLVEAYAQLAIDEGWTATAHRAKKLPSEQDAAAARKAKSKKRGAEGASVGAKLEKAKKRRTDRYAWETVGERLDAAWVEKREASIRSKGAATDFAERVEAIEGEYFALKIEGPFSRARLAFEHGVHAETKAERREVRVCVTDTASTLGHPHDLPWPVGLRRLRHHGRSVVHDATLDHHVDNPAQLVVAYRKLMRASLYHAVFGARGVSWAKRWGRE